MPEPAAAPSRAKVVKKARTVFPELDVLEVLDWLDDYGVEPYERERERVQLAILKLCQEEGLNTPDRFVKAAKQDYRDVLAWAEYPGQVNAAWFRLPPGEQAKVRRADLEQYLAWLTT